MSDSISLKKARTATAPGATDAPAKEKKLRKTDAKNREAIKGKARQEKDLMYRYIDKDRQPVADEDKKKYRAAARKKLDSYEKKIKKAKGEERAKLVKNANIFIKKTYNPGIKPEFA